MKILNKIPMLVTISFLLIACGKQAVNKEATGGIKTIEPTTGELYFQGYSDIRRAFFDNEHEDFEYLFAKYPNIGVNEMLKEGDTFLTYSIRHHFVEIRNFLIASGANINLPNINQESPLIVAVKNNRKTSVQRLIDLKADLDHLDNEKDTALHSALKLNLDDIAVMLINAGAKIQLMDKHGKSSLKIAQESNVPNALELIMTILHLEFGAPDITSFKKLVTNADHKSLAMVLGRYPYLLKDSNYDSLNPFAILVDSQDESSAVKSAEILIEYKGNVNGPEGSIQTPLIKAVKNNKKIFTNILLSANANPHYMDDAGKTALIHAIENNNFDLVNILLSYSAIEKYTVRINDKPVTFNACTFAKKTAKTLKTAQEKETNKRIKKILKCGLINWIFG